MPSEYANFSIALSAFYFFSMANAPLRMLFAKTIPEYIHFDKRGKIKTLTFIVIKYLLIFTIIFFVFLFVFNKSIIKVLKLPSPIFIYIIGLFIILGFFISIGRGIANGLRDYSDYNKSFYIESISRLLITIFILYLIKTAFAAFSSYVIAFILALTYLIHKTKHILNYEKMHVNLRDVFSLIKPLFLFSISFMAFYSIDMFMAKAYLTGQEAGYYSAASQLSKSIAIIGSSFSIMLLPHITEKFLNQINPLVEFLKIKGIFIVIGVLIVVFFALFSEKIISVLYTKEYSDASNLLLPLGIGTLFMTLSSMIGNYFLAVRKYIAFIIPMFTVFLEIVLIYLWHSSPQKISYMFLFSQSFMFIGLFISLFVVKPKKYSNI